MDWESGDGLCGRALPNLGGCQTRHGKHLKVNNKKNSSFSSFKQTSMTSQIYLYS